ncbi:helix-turn-helix domain-containing protein [Roseisolibacter sp. H3M3-2]|uniref:ArsR/SmtB family transcription factor n=1 Tax=Roseisolibacter sp. H3M3-2 TaxID=3031323 RepID=UPI0023DCD7E4|nr:helix-turn-helix domain-containing protein [Roseisolibacter sp. H3M3-2]MDF1504195.1 helix-turn-helix domain-containing protein [Roseisolibacter sp. H3M3-2]
MTDEELDRVFKALGDPTRRRIIDRLRERPEQSLFELCAGAAADGGVALSRQAVTQHLDLLERAGLVRVAWAGRTKLHSLDLGPLHAAVAQWLRPHL